MDQTLPKSIILSILALITILLLGLSSVELISSIEFILLPHKHISELLYFSISFAAFLSINSLLEATSSTILKSGTKFLYGIALFGVLAVLSEFDIRMLLPFTVTLFAFFAFQFNFQNSYLNLIKPKLFKAISESASILIILFSLAFSLMFYNLNRNINHTDIISDELVNGVISPVSKIVESQINQQINSQLEGEIGKLRDLNQTELNAVKSRLDSQVRQYLGSTDLDINTKNIDIALENLQDGIKVTGLSNQMGNLIKKQLDTLLKPYDAIMPAVAAALFYLFISFVLKISVLIAELFTFILVNIVLSTGFVTKEIEEVEVERLKFPTATDDSIDPSIRIR